MIRINLLPFRAAKRKENIKRQITLFALIVFLALAAISYGSIQLYSKVSALQAQKSGLKKDLANYDKTLKEIDRLKKQIKEIRAKLNVIQDLEKKKTGPVKLLDEVALAVPKDKMWLRRFNENKGRLTLEGTAMDNETVALFMTNLEKAGQIRSVDLKSTKLKRLAKYKLDVIDFVINCTTAAFKPKKPTPKKGKKGR
jgi:type IV pilus assembly protein PilN